MTWWISLNFPRPNRARWQRYGKQILNSGRRRQICAPIRLLASNPRFQATCKPLSANTSKLHTYLQDTRHEMTRLFCENQRHGGSGPSSEAVLLAYCPNEMRWYAANLCLYTIYQYNPIYYKMCCVLVCFCSRFLNVGLVITAARSRLFCLVILEDWITNEVEL